MSDAHFCIFWAEKNAERKAQGAELLNFREARKEFGFHVPPPGAVTLCWGGEDIRAFPGKTPQDRDTWYAQYRQVSAKGVLWRMINDANKQPICYVGATEALNAAKLARDSGGLRVDNPDKPRREIELAGGVSCRVSRLKGSLRPTRPSRE